MISHMTVTRNGRLLRCYICSTRAIDAECWFFWKDLAYCEYHWPPEQAAESIEKGIHRAIPDAMGYRMDYIGD